MWISYEPRQRLHLQTAHASPGEFVWKGLLDCCIHLLAGPLEDCDFLLETVTKPVSFYVQIEAGLQVEPKSIRGAEVSRKTQRRVGRDRSRTVYDLIDSPRRHADVLSEPVLRQSKGFQEVMKQDFARVNRIQLATGHRYLSDSRLFPRGKHRHPPK